MPSNIVALLSAPPGLSPQYRAQFRAEQRCTIEFAGLRPVLRVFV